MAYIHFPQVFKSDPLIAGPLLEPTNEAQQETYDAAVKAKQDYDIRHFDSDLAGHFAAHVIHNFSYAGRRFLPFSILESAADVVEPYSNWCGYDRLILWGNKYAHNLLPYTRSNMNSEDEYRAALVLLRRFKHDAAHASDIVALDDAIEVCINRIDKVRMRQRKRRELRI